MLMEYVMVTLKAGTVEADLKLPAEIPVAELLKMLEEPLELKQPLRGRLQLRANNFPAIS